MAIKSDTKKFQKKKLHPVFFIFYFPEAFFLKDWKAN
jgi:hypothetical protein